MSIYILAPDPSGACCDCTGRMSPCDSCATGSCLECQTKGGTIPYCGTPGLAGSGYYKRTELAGEQIACLYFSSSTCSGPSDGGQRFLFGGTCVWTPTCVSGNSFCNLTSTGTVLQQPPTVGCSVWEPGSTRNVCSLDYGDFTNVILNGSTVSQTNTVRSVAGNNICILNGGAHWTVDGTATQTLSDEDTRSDAVTRLLSCSDWMGSGTNCANISDNQTYILNQWRLSRSGLMPNTIYDFTTTYWRRLIGATDWTLYQTVDASDTTDAFGNLITDYVEVPIAYGYETEARGGCNLTPT